MKTKETKFAIYDIVTRALAYGPFDSYGAACGKFTRLELKAYDYCIREYAPTAGTPTAGSAEDERAALKNRVERLEAALDYLIINAENSPHTDVMLTKAISSAREALKGGK